MKHLEVRWLWLQERVRAKQVHIEKVLGTHNPANLGTKILSGERVVELCNTIGLGDRVWGAAASRIIRLVQGRAVPAAAAVLSAAALPGAEAVEANARAESTALQEQHAAALSAMQAQLHEQLGRERASMEEELESRSRLVAMQVSELKAAHSQQMADMKASMTSTSSAAVGSGSVSN